MIFVISVYKSWIVGQDITDYSGLIKSGQTGLHTIPSHGWLYARAGRFVGSDESLTFIFN